MKKLLAFFFGCAHTRTTFPLSPRTRRGFVAGSPHVTCLDCGKEFDYDWSMMQRGRELQREAMVQRSVQGAEVIE